MILCLLYLKLGRLLNANQTRPFVPHLEGFAGIFVCLIQAGCPCGAVNSGRQCEGISLEQFSLETRDAGTNLASAARATSYVWDVESQSS